MTVANLLPMPVLLPLLGAALTLVARRHPRVQVAISIAVLAASLAVAATLMWSTHHDGPIALWLGAWSEPLGIALVADRISALMLLISSFVILVVLVCVGAYTLLKPSMGQLENLRHAGTRRHHGAPRIARGRDERGLVHPCQCLTTE